MKISILVDDLAANGHIFGLDDMNYNFALAEGL